MEFTHDRNNLKIGGFEDIATGNRIETDSLPLFEIFLKDKKRITSNDFILTEIPEVMDISGDNNSTVYGERFPGKKYSAYLENNEYGISLHWLAYLRDGSNYIRQIFKFEAEDPNIIRKVTLIKLPALGTSKIGTVDGSPIVHENMFFA